MARKVKTYINQAPVLEAFKFFLIKERYRHMQDIIQIDEDLAKMDDIPICADNVDGWIEIKREAI
jgi:hypothetical protein